MAKTRLRKRQAAAERSPKTIGELRKLLAQLGNPWQPDPRLSDAEPIPEYPTGGDGTVGPVGKVVPKGGVIAAIRANPPSNPHLRELWAKRGLIRRAGKIRARASRKIRRPSGHG